MEIDAEGKYLLRHPGREQFGHRALSQEPGTLVLEAGGVVHHQPGRLDFGGDLGQLKLHRLELGDGAAELLPLLDVLHRMVEGSLGKPHHLGADPDPSLVQGLDGDLVALAELSSTFSPGTRTSSSTSSVVDEARIPSLSSFFPTEKPGMSRSTMKAVIPL